MSNRDYQDEMYLNWSLTLEIDDHLLFAAGRDIL
jgi:hypothetical protein